MTKYITLFLLFLLFASSSFASDLTLSWLPNTERTLAGYKIYWGHAEGVYNHELDIGLPSLKNGRVYYTITNVSGDVVYFVVTAYDTNRIESEYSKVVEYKPLPNSPCNFKLVVLIQYWLKNALSLIIKS